MRVELIYDADCPNVPSARSQLIKAFAYRRIGAVAGVGAQLLRDS